MRARRRRRPVVARALRRTGEPRRRLHGADAVVDVLAVNIRAGGSRNTIDRLIARACQRERTAIVLSEFRNTAAGARIRDLLTAAGYDHQATSEHPTANGVLIAAREPFVAVPNPFALGDDEYPDAIVQATFASGLRLYGVYLPGQTRKRPHLRCLIAAAAFANERGIDALCIGDFNSGRNRTDIQINAGGGPLKDEFDTADLYAELETEWTEAWLHLHPETLDYSWYPFRLQDRRTPRNGWRIDKAFVSRSLLPRLVYAEYDHGFRTEKLTDHSGLAVGFS